MADLTRREMLSLALAAALPFDPQRLADEIWFHTVRFGSSDDAKMKNILLADGYGPGRCRHPHCRGTDTLEYRRKGLCLGHQSKCFICHDKGTLASFVTEHIADRRTLAKKKNLISCPRNCEAAKKLGFEF